MGHLKRHSTPTFWPIERKGFIWIAKPSPGPHSIERSLPLVVLIRDILKIADTAKEARTIIKQGKILVDKKVRKDQNFPLGLMDKIDLTDAKRYLMIDLGKKGPEAVDITESESAKKICRIEGKKTLSGGVTQLNLHDGRNILAENPEYKVGDSLVISLPEQQILDHLKFDKGASVKIIGGKNIGLSGQIADLHARKSVLERNKVVVDSDGKMVETLKHYILVVDGSGKVPSALEKPKKSKAK